MFIVFELFLCCCPVSSCNLSQVARSHLGPGERPRPKVQQGPEGPGGQVEEVRHRPGPEEEAALRQGGRGDCHHRGYGRRGESPFTLSSPGSSPGTWHQVRATLDVECARLPGEHGSSKRRNVHNVSPSSWLKIVKKKLHLHPFK